MPSLRPELPELPRHMRGLPLDHRGYPTPWFAAWTDNEGNQTPRGIGKPDFRLQGGNAVAEAVNGNRCWICGGRLGKYRAFVIGPMCAINRVNAEPPSHVECADFSGRACPFLSRPHARRNDSRLPDGVVESPGIAIMRNPKVCCVWIISGKYGHRKVPPRGVLFDLPEPDELRWYCEGREATFAEIEESVVTGAPELFKHAGSPQEEDEITARIAALYVRLRNAGL